MRGSSINNIKFNPHKQKIICCEACGNDLIVGKFAKKGQYCDTCKKIPKGKEVAHKSANSVVKKSVQSNFAAKLSELARKLGFTVDDKHLWRKRYAIDGGGVATIHIMVEPNIAGEGPRLEYFCLSIQRAVGINEEFRQFMTPDAASDCEMLVSELVSQSVSAKHQIGFVKCDGCGAVTDQFGVDTKNGKTLCMNRCFKTYINNAGAQAEV